MNTIHISVQAYNAEKTLARAIDSILAQTYKDYVIYVCDDASTDSTADIIRDYEKRGLIKAYFNDTNSVYSESGNEFLEVKNHISNDDFYAQLDADDELLPQFFEKLLNFAVENDLDIAEGSRYFNTDGVISVEEIQASLKNNIVLDTPEDFDKYFDYLYNYSSTIWGKLFRGNVSGELKYTLSNFGYGHDTASVFTVFIKARKVGLFCEPLVVYYKNPSSVSFKYDSRRIYFPAFMFSLSKTVLSEKANGISEDNEFFIYYNYVYQTLYSLSFYYELKITVKELINCIEYILKCEATAEIYWKIDYFKVIKENFNDLDLLSSLFNVILANFTAIDPDKIRELYYLIFGLVYSRKTPKFTAAEIDFLLNIDFKLANAILKGDFENARIWLEKLPKSITEFGISQKIRQLAAQNMS
jgi:glycosyltransferase involved in cell wall biosynthesis